MSVLKDSSELHWFMLASYGVGAARAGKEAVMQTPMKILI